MYSATYSELLRGNKDFRRLWIGQAISEMGSWFSFIAQLGLVRVMSGSPWATTALLVSRVLPFLLISPLAGVLVDRRSRKQILIWTDVLRAIVALGYLVAAARGAVWIVVACSGLNASLTLLFDAAKTAAMPNLTAPRELLTANVLMFSTRFLQLTLGAALGGLTAAQFGYRAAFVANALSFLASAAFILPIPAEHMRQRGGGEAPKESRRGFFDDVSDGLRYIWATPFVRGIILVNIGWATGGGMTYTLFDQMGSRIFPPGADGEGDWNVALLFTISGLGLLIGMLLARRVGGWVADERRAGHFIGWMLIAHGVLFSASGLMPALLWMALLVGLSRLLLAIEFGVQETFVMRVLPDDYRGRVFTADRSLEYGMMTVSMMLGGWLLTWASPRAVVVVSGLLAASPGVVWLAALALTRFRVPPRAVRDSFSESYAD